MEKDKLIEKLSKEQDIAAWKDLRIHAARDAILMVANDITLTEVGAEFAADNKDMVSIWIKEKTIKKLDKDFLNMMETQMEKKYHFIIVQPFVLIQEILN
jgi:hypothetical protein